MGIKNALKRIPFVVCIAQKKENLPARVLSVLSPTMASRYVYYKRLGKKLDIKHPQLYNEKLMWLKLHIYRNNPLVTECADKYRVRNYINRCGMGYLLNHLYGVWKSPEEIPWEQLPGQFVLKCNHGCDYNIICEDKSKLDICQAKKDLRHWLRDDFWKNAAELNYRDIPRCIICERYIGTESGRLPADIKIYCFNGEPLIIGYYYDRQKQMHNQKRGYFDFEWNPIPYMQPQYYEEAMHCQKPPYLNQIKQAAKILCAPFPFVRVDFFEYRGKPVFAELTFTPLFCAGDMFTEEGMKLLGSKIALPIDEDPIICTRRINLLPEEASKAPLREKQI